jgi:uncharacterized repeat protein (TIGR01451 family)
MGNRRLILLVLLLVMALSVVPSFAQEDDGDEQDDATASQVQTARPAVDATGVLQTDLQPSPDELDRIAELRSQLNPEAYRYTLDESFVPYEDGEINFAPPSPAIQAGDPSLPSAGALPDSGPVTVLVLFSRSSALDTVRPTDIANSEAQLNAVNSAAAQVRAAQAGDISTLQGTFGATLVSELSHVFSGVVVTVDVSQIDAIAALPNVSGVYPDQPVELENANSVPFIGTVSAWTNGTGFTGDGIDVGIIDSGIDYLHTNFGGPGSGYGSADTLTLDGTEFNSKVVGGFDYVGDGWVAGAPLAPDPDPWDCNGHGSHVAGTAGGFGVNSDGTTYTGAYNATTDFADLRVGPGVAPESRLHALKIGDCTPSVSFVGAIAAIDNYVIPEGLDVVNNSYGGPYGTPLEPLVLAFERATDAGVIMVGSAGNSGDTYFVNGAPNIANSNIAVASTVSDVAYQGLLVDDLGAGTSTVVPVSNSVNGNPAIPPIGPLPLLAVTGPGTAGGCNATDYDDFTGPNAGAVAVIRWDDGTCGSVTRMTNAVNNGNVGGLVVITTDPADAPFILLNCGDASGGPVTTSPISCVSTQLAEDYLFTNPTNYEVTFDGTLSAFLSDSFADQVSSFTSRGPVIAAGDTVRLKPDVSAPGDLIFSAAAGTGTEGVFLGGTSMAAPHVAGVAALLRQIYPTYSVQQIKALIMNTATNDLWTGINQTGDNFSPPRIGTGRVDVQNAIQHNAIAYSADNPEGVHVSFGVIDAVAPGSMVQRIIIQDTSGTGGTYNVNYTPYLDANGVSVTLSASSVSVPANGSATINVTLNYDPAAMDEDALIDPTMTTTQATGFGAFPRAWNREESGYVTFSGPGSDLRVAVHAMPRPAGDRSLAANPVSTGPTGSTFIDLQGPGVDTSGTLTRDQFSVVSQVSAFNALVTMPNDGLTGPELDRGDIQHIGISSDYQAQLDQASGNVATAIGNTTIFIGFSTYDNWSTHQPYDVLYDMFFDPEEDGTFQINVFNWDGAALFGFDFTDTPLNLLYVGGSFGGFGSFNNGFQATNDMYPFNNNVVMVPIPASWLGLSDTNTDFNFDFGTLVDLNGYFDFSPIFGYDVTTDEVFNFNDASGNVGGPFPGPPTWFDLDPFNLPVDYDFSGLPPSASPPPVLLLHHHNGSNVTRPELVFFDAPTVTIDKTVADTTVVTGQDLTYTLTVTNNSGAATTDPYVVRDLLPDDVTYVSDTCPTASTVTPAPGAVVECTIPAGIPAGGSTSFDIVATINADGGTTFTNNVELTLAGAPVVVQLDVAELDYTVPSALVATKEVVSAGSTGDEITYAVTLTNGTPDDIVGDLFIRDIIPAGLTYVSDTCAGSFLFVDAVSGNDVLECPIPGGLAAGASFSFDIVATIDAPVGTSIVNVIEVYSDDDPDELLTQTDNTFLVQDLLTFTTLVETENGFPIFNGSVVPSFNVTQMVMTFSDDLLGGTGPDGAENPDNYRLLAEGSGENFTTRTCDEPVAVDDIPLDFTVSHDGGNVVTMTITGPDPYPPLTEGQYRVMICGSTSIMNTSGVPLDGNGDGVPGDDAVVTFTIGRLESGQPGGEVGGVVQPEDLGVTELPATGETPLWAWILQFILDMDE